MEVSGQLHAPAALASGKVPQSRSGRGGEEKNSQALPVLEPPIIQPVPFPLIHLDEISLCNLVTLYDFVRKRYAVTVIL